MTDLFTFQNLVSLLMLCFLQAVLGFDNLLYISIESRRAPAQHQRNVRKYGIILAVALRVVLLLIMVQLIDSLREPFFVLDFPGVLQGGVNFATIVFLFGGIFIIYTAVAEISHMLLFDEHQSKHHQRKPKSAIQVVTLIVVMNLIFSFDSILSALAITDVIPVLALAIAASGVAMLALADGVTEFLKTHRMFEVLGLFILLIVGVVLIGEAGPAAAHAMHDDSLQIRIFGYELLPMSKTTFYFSTVVLFIVEIIQSIYQKRIATSR